MRSYVVCQKTTNSITPYLQKTCRSVLNASAGFSFSQRRDGQDKQIVRERLGVRVALLSSITQERRFSPVPLRTEAWPKHAIPIGEFALWLPPTPLQLLSKSEALPHGPIQIA